MNQNKKYLLSCPLILQREKINKNKKPSYCKLKKTGNLYYICKSSKYKMIKKNTHQIFTFNIPIY